MWWNAPYSGVDAHREMNGRLRMQPAPPNFLSRGQVRDAGKVLDNASADTVFPAGLLCRGQAGWVGGGANVKRRNILCTLPVPLLRFSRPPDLGVLGDAVRETTYCRSGKSAGERQHGALIFGPARQRFLRFAEQH